MLTKLSIKNFALIDSLSVDFKEGLSIITGETGAGKSILLGALGLALGKRADSSTLKNAEQKCIIEGQFRITDYKLNSFFASNDIDFEEDTIIRREILPSGKSRAFINDTPTTLNILQSLSEKLIDIHSQHQTMQLSDMSFQFQIIDAIAKNDAKIASYKRGLLVYQQIKKTLNSLREEQSIANEQYEYNLHLFEELNAAKLENGEQEEIEKKLDELNNIEEIKLQLLAAQEIALADDVGLQSLLSAFIQNLNKISGYADSYKSLYDRILSLKIEFDDITQEIEGLNESVNFEPQELEKINDRLQLIYNLQKKHGVNSIEALINVQDVLSSKVAAVENSSQIILAKEEELAEVVAKIDKLADLIRKGREKAIPVLIRKLEVHLRTLGMENTRFKIDLIPLEKFMSNGKDELQLLISANKGANYGVLKKVASGGEMSRIMLSIKSILSDYLKLPTIIFDEIDTGVSGDVSQKMADIMSAMCSNMQVITITHLPQIAAKGGQHYKVFKREIKNDIVTQLKELTEKERVEEIAEMLGGKKITTTALEHAKQLLN